MPKHDRAIARIATAGSLALLPCLVACERGAPTAPPSKLPSEGAVKYTVRGVVKQIPIAGDPRTSFAVHHEAIPTFQKQGKIIGMAEMTMDFPLGPGVTLDGIHVGAIVEIDFEVVEQPSMKYYITRLTKLPADTVLSLRAGG